MGMAASQARLLALTTRMHNIELRAQNIEAQKLELAVREDEAYQKYCDALDAKKIQVGYIGELGRMSYIDANYNSVCGYHDNYACQFSLINNKTGKVIVPADIKEFYDEYGGDKYTFALMAAGYEEDAFSWEYEEGSPFEYFDNIMPEMVGINTNIDGDYFDPEENPNGLNGAMQWAAQALFTTASLCPPGCGSDIYMNEVEYMAFCYLVEDQSDPKAQQLYEKYYLLLNSSQNEEDNPPGKRQQLLNEFRDYLYQIGGSLIIQLMNVDKSEYGYFGPEGVYHNEDGSIPEEDDYEYNLSWNSGEMEYYMNLWDQIRQAGGCETLDAQYQSGEDGTEWFNNMVNAGMISIYTLKDPDQGWQSTTLATSVGNNYLQEVNDDEKAKRAEVEYEHELKIINRKDTKFDNELKKLETEESACKTEIDSVKKIIQDNIEKNFNLFS